MNNVKCFASYSSHKLHQALRITKNLLHRIGIFSIVTCICILSSTSVYSTQEVNTQDEISLLRTLGLVNDTYLANDVISRGEFVDVVVKMLGYEAEDQITKSKFKDVSPASPYLSSIEYAVNIGLISGLKDNTFRPSKAISYYEAIKVLCNSLGYSELAQQYGGYPSGYIKVATGKKIIKGSALNNANSLTKGEAAKLFYNTLHAPILKQIVFGSDNKFEVSSDMTLLSQYHKIYKVEGVVNKTENIDLAGFVYAPRGYIAISDHLYASKENCDDYAGMLVTAYVKELDDKEYEIAYITPHKKNITTVVPAEDIQKDEVTYDTFVYSPGNDDKKQKMKISPKAYMIYNGQAKLSYTKVDLTPDCGTVTLIDRDADGTADTVIVNEYQTMVLESVGVNNGYLLNKYIYDGALKSLTVDVNDKDTVLKIKKLGKEVLLESLKPNDVLLVSLSETGKKTISIIVSDKIESGVVDEINDVDGNLTLDGKVYEYSYAFKTALKRNDANAQRMMPNDQATIYIDDQGKIAAFERQHNGKYQYGYLRHAISEGAFHEEVQFRILTEQGKWDTLTAAKKVKLDGVLMKAADVIKTAPVSNNSGSTVNKQLLKYSLNAQGYITEIQTATYNLSPETEMLRVKYYNNIIYRSPNQSFDSTIYLDDIVKAFIVPVEAEYQDDETCYSVESATSYFSDWGAYQISAYDYDRFGLAKSLIVKRSYLDIGKAKVQGVFVFTKMTRALIKGSDATMLYGALGGNSYASAPLSEDCNNISLKEGDILSLTRNADGEICDISKTFAQEDAPTEQSKVLNGNLHGTEVYIYGKVKATEPLTERILLDDGLADFKSFRLEQKDVNIYVFEKSNKKLWRGKLTDIEIGDFVFIRYVQSIPQEVIIYR